MIIKMIADLHHHRNLNSNILFVCLSSKNRASPKTRLSLCLPFENNSHMSTNLRLGQFVWIKNFLKAELISSALSKLSITNKIIILILLVNRIVNFLLPSIFKILIIIFVLSVTQEKIHPEMVPNWKKTRQQALWILFNTASRITRLILKHGNKKLKINI